MKRFQSRRGNGRYQRNTLENCFGLTAHVCPHCRGFNPVPVGGPMPEVCCQCGRPMTDPEPEAEHGHGPEGV